MEYLVQFQLNIYAFLMLMILYATILIRTKVKSIRRNFLNHTLILTAISVILEPLTWIFDAETYAGAYFLEYTSNFLLILIAPFIAGMFLNYMDYVLFHQYNRLKKRWFYMQPTILTLIILIVNFFYPIYFGVHTGSNSFFTADYIYIHYIILYVGYIYIVYLAVRYRQLLRKYEYIIFISFFFFPLIGLFLSMINSHFYFSWTSIAFGIFVVYIFLESTNGEIDHLTRLYSRSSYELYINEKIDNHTPFKVLSIDLDNFKNINDTMGHFKGDQVLYEFSQCLMDAIAPNKMAARLGGDEFICVVRQDCDVEKLLEKLQLNLNKLEDEVCRNVKFSYGCEESNVDANIDNLYLAVDKKLYQVKRSHKGIK